ncbi:MAG: PHP domain-containing protein [Candidatus Omnitrophica bacterium]|nr:PHP domain-containing protein [Candidatus Omnitrophota bacterium]
MNKTADLHIHSFYSDSSSSPQEIVEEALREKVGCIAIADHDTLEGVQPTIEAAADNDLEVLAGVELSAEIHQKDVHILGYCFDHNNETFLNQLKKFQDHRLERIKEMLENLRAEGINNISFEEVFALTRSNSISRVHLAKLLIEKGWVVNTFQAFARYLGDQCPTYVPKYRQTPCEAIELINKAGGVAVLAHPMVTNKDELIASFVEAGLGGIEVYYPNCSATITTFYAGLAKKYDLVMTGGSDAHGGFKHSTYIGKIQIDYENVVQLKERSAFLG